MGSIQKKFVAACLKFCRDSGRESHQQFRFPSPILARFPARLLGENLGEIRGRIPARFWPPGLLLPSENHGENRGRIVPRFWPPGISFPVENLAGIPTGKKNLGGQNLAGMLPRISPRFSPRSKFTVAKTSARSCRESRQDWQREAKFLVRFTAGISAKF